MPEALVSLVVSTSLLLGSPGPATMSLAAVGAAGGFVRGLPYLAGILLGLGVAVIIGAAGMGALFEAFPATRFGFQVIGGAYIVYIAWKIGSAPVDDETNGGVRIPSFRDGFILNLFNAKAYAAFLALFSGFLLPGDSWLLAYAITAGTIFVVAIVVDTIWLAFGGLLRPVFRRPREARALRILFAILIVLSLVYAFR